jgi:hypothetical protein
MTHPIPWTPYFGHYHKIEYDVQLASGEVVRRCWPNGGDFHGFGGRVVSGDEVEAVRPWLPEAFLAKCSATDAQEVH